MKTSGSQRDVSERWEVEHLGLFTRPATQPQSFHLTLTVQVCVCVRVCAAHFTGEDIKEDDGGPNRAGECEMGFFLDASNWVRAYSLA